MKRLSDLIAAIEAIPDHSASGRECEWDCGWDFERELQGKGYPTCQIAEPEHDHELVSRQRVIAEITRFFDL